MPVERNISPSMFPQHKSLLKLHTHLSSTWSKMFPKQNSTANIIHTPIHKKESVTEDEFLPPVDPKVLSMPIVEDKSWRCDMHPAWSRDYQWVAINGRPGGQERQVIVVHVGADLSNYFRGT